MVLFPREATQVGNRCKSAASYVVKVHKNLCIHREIDIDSGTEFDEAKMLINSGFLTLLSVSDNAASHSTGHLTHRDTLPVVAEDTYCGALVLCTALRKIGRQKTTAMMTHILYRAVNREPIGMDIERRHKYRYLNGFALQIFRLEHLLHNHHLAIDGTNSPAETRTFIVAFRATEEVEDENIKHQ